MNIASWLRRTPVPVAILADGRRCEVPTNSKRKWAELTETIETLGATRLEAIDANGVVLRACSLEGDETTDEKRPGDAKGQTDLQVFASLLSAAYTQGSNATKDAYAMAFSENTNLVSILAARLSSLETAWQRSMSDRANLVAQLAQRGEDEDGGGEFMQLLALMRPDMGGLLAASKAKHVNGKPPAKEAKS